MVGDLCKVEKNIAKIATETCHVPLNVEVFACLLSLRKGTGKFINSLSS